MHLIVSAGEVKDARFLQESQSVVIALAQIIEFLYELLLRGTKKIDVKFIGASVKSLMGKPGCVFIQ